MIDMIVENGGHSVASISIMAQTGRIVAERRYMHLGMQKSVFDQ